jgi:hypothetical protein
VSRATRKNGRVGAVDVSRRRMYDARDYLGSDDIGAAVNRTIAAAAADGYGYGKPGQVVLPPGSWAQTTEIVPMDGVDLFGSGWGKTVLRPQGTISSVRLTSRTSGTPLTECKFADFEIDGVGQTGSPYNVGTKGFYIIYMKRCSFDHVKIVNTPATGLGIDMLVNTTIHDVYTDNCGRGNGGANPGGNGIGIGTGTYTVEDFTVSDCVALNSGRWGIMVETQNSAVFSQGGKIVGCHVKGNQIGLVDAGMGGCVWTGNTVIQNGTGVAVNAGTFTDPTLGKLGQFSNNIIQNNTSHGIYYDATVKQVGPGYTFNDNTITSNGGSGVLLAMGTTTTSRQIAVVDNEIGLNAGGGIYETSNGALCADLTITGNRIWSNAATNGSHDGINIAGSVTRGKIAGNRFWGIISNPGHRYSLRIEPAAVLTDVDFDGNDVGAGFVTAGFSYVAASTASSTIGYNKGWTVKTGTPEGGVRAPVGTLYRRTDGGAGTTHYVKETGTDNTGWVGK